MKPYRLSAPRPPDQTTETPPALGALKSHHAAPKSSRVFRILAPVAVAVPPAVIVITSGEGFDAVILGLIGFLTLLAAAVGWFISPAKAFAVDLHEGGLVLRGRRRIEVCFDDVDEVWLQLYVGDSSLTRTVSLRGIRLVTGDKREVLISSTVEAFDLLLKRVDRACTYPLVAPAEAAIAAGETLTFGKVRLDRESISV
jgi:hypothetical protein